MGNNFSLFQGCTSKKKSSGKSTPPTVEGLTFIVLEKSDAVTVSLCIIKV